MITYEMKPCPFCGSNASLYYTGEQGQFRAECNNEDCGCALPPWVLCEKGENVFDRMTLAVEYWNKRADETTKTS